ncbi:hypothetical protein V9R59_003094 [Vibrio harveyi]
MGGQKLKKQKDHGWSKAQKAKRSWVTKSSDNCTNQSNAEADTSYQPLFFVGKIVLNICTLSQYHIDFMKIKSRE